MNIKHYIILVFCVLVSLSAKAQPCTGMTISDADVSHLKILKLYYDNDLFSGTDQYYTQGFGGELIVPRFKNLFLSKRILFRIGHRARTYYGLSIHHKAFTPMNINAVDVVNNDRPYSSEFMIGHFLISNDKDRKIRLKTEFDIGVIGPFTGGEYLAGSQSGWDNQIKTDLLLRYMALLEKSIVDKKGFDLIAMGRAEVSTIQPHLALGGKFRIGRLNPYFYSYEFCNRSIQGNREIKPFQVYLYGRGEGRVIGYDARLQGGLLNGSSPYTLPGSELQRIVAEGAVGVEAIFKSFGIGYEHVILTPEFKSAETHLWGQVKVYFAW